MKRGIGLIMGPMFSGKSSELIHRIKRLQQLSMNILVINHSFDTRYGDNVIASHDRTTIDCHSLKSLCDIYELKDYDNSDVIVIEEGQFFDDLVDVCKTACDRDGKRIIVAGLSGDSSQKPFSSITNLIPKCDWISMKQAYCKRCNDGTLAPFTRRITDNNEIIQVGGERMYEAVCREHLIS